MKKAGGERQNAPPSKFFFADSHRKWRVSIQNETGAPYGTAHNTNVNPDDGCLQQDTVDTIANLETSTASNCAAIAELTAIVTRLTTELAMVNVKLVVAFQTNRTSRGGHRGRNRTTRGRRDGTGAGAGTGTRSGSPARTGVSAPTMDEAKDLDPPIHNCWTCSPGCRQNSSKCPVPAAGHIYMDTNRNIKGGAEATQ